MKQIRFVKKRVNTITKSKIKSDSVNKCVKLLKTKKIA